MHDLVLRNYLRSGMDAPALGLWMVHVRIGYCRDKVRFVEGEADRTIKWLDLKVL